MIESFYVDDLVTGEDNTGKAFSFYEKSKNRLASGGLKFRKWMTNDKALNDCTRRESRNHWRARDKRRGNVREVHVRIANK